MSRLKQLISEVHRRSLWQVLTVYLVGAAVGYQLVQALTDGLGLPDWFPALAIVLFIIGFPIVLATALVQEGAPLVSRRDPTLLPGGEALTADTQTVKGTKRLLTWRNAILGGALAFTLLGIGTGGYMTMRVMGIGPVGSLVAAGALEARDRVVLADFESSTGDSLLAIAATEAFRIDLSQSQMIRVAERDYVAGVLDRMERDPSTPLDYDVAREVAIRDGLKAVIAGEVNSAGVGFVLSVRLVAVESGEVLAAYREAANDSSEVIPAIDRLSKKLRERIGESLKTIRTNEPLEEVTTTSLEALQKYSQAGEPDPVGVDQDRRIRLLEEAIAIDTTFAAAYVFLGRILAGRGSGTWPDRERAIAALTKAYELRHRLTEKERLWTEGIYLDHVRGETRKAITVYQTLLELDPEDKGVLNNLGRLYYMLRDYPHVEETLLRLIDLESSDTASVVHYGNVVQAQVVLGRLADAKATFERMAELYPEHRNTANRRYALAVYEGDYDAAEVTAREFRAKHTGNLEVRATTSFLLAIVSRLRGELSESESHMRDMMAAQVERGLIGEALEAAVALGFDDLLLRRDAGRALAVIEQFLDRHPLDSIPILNRPYLVLAPFYSYAGRFELGAATLRDYEDLVDPLVRRSQEINQFLTRGMIAIAEERYDEAITELRQYHDRAVSPIGGLQEMGVAYDRAGEPDSAIVYFERYLSTPDLSRIWGDSWTLANTYERLGALYENRGDTEKAIYYYGKFVDLWKDADPVLLPRVDAARRAIAALSPDQ